MASRLSIGRSTSLEARIDTISKTLFAYQKWGSHFVKPSISHGLYGVQLLKAPSFTILVEDAPEIDRHPAPNLFGGEQEYLNVTLVTWSICNLHEYPIILFTYKCIYILRSYGRPCHDMLLAEAIG